MFDFHDWVKQYFEPAFDGFDWQSPHDGLISVARRLGTKDHPNRMGNTVEITFLPLVLRALDAGDAQRRQAIGERTYTLLRAMLVEKSLSNAADSPETINVDSTVLDV